MVEPADARNDGSVSFVYVVPLVKPGTYTLKLIDRDLGLTASAKLEVIILKGGRLHA
jgi:hypothetical protein